MNIKALLIALGAILIMAAGGYWFYHQYYAAKAYPLRGLIPADAVLVYESRQPEAAWDSLQRHSFGEVLKEMPALERIKSYEAELKRLLPSYERLKNRDFLFSLHITERHNFDYLLLMPLSGAKDQALLKELKKEIEDSPQLYRLNERTYQDVKLFEIRDLKGGRTFSFFVEEGVLAGSFTSFLVEAAIRRKAAGGADTIPAWLKDSQSATLNESLGKLSLNLQQVPELLRVFANNDSVVREIVPRLPYFSHLDASTEPDGLLLTGFTQLYNPEAADFLWALHDQKPQPMRLDYMVPIRSASLMFVGLSTPKQWHQQLLAYWQKKAPEQWERWQVLQAKAPEAKGLVPLIGHEIGLAVVPTTGAANPDRLLVMQLTDSETAATFMRKLIGKMASADTLYSETFLQQQLQELPYNEFPAALLGSAYLGFKESYYTIVENYLVISSSIPALKEMLQDIQAEETWQRSVRLNSFVSRLDAEQNYALYLNTAALWPMLYRRLAQPWKSFWDKHNLALRQVDLLSLQLSATDGVFYTNLFLHLDRRPERQLEQIRITKKAESQLESPVVHAPVGIAYRQQRNNHWLVQDSARTLYLLNEAGEKVRTATLGGYWQQLAEIDPQKNKNLHYLISTQDSVYLLQPNLQNLSPFPLALPVEERIQWTNVVDYDASGRYRFLLASSTGNLYMYDLDGINLEGWQPLKLNGALSTAPGHMRVRSKDIIYAFQQKGTVHVLSRRGQYFAGFPLHLGDSLLGPVHIRQGSDFKSSRFITVTASGLLYEWDLEGRIITRKQLYRPDARARFYLVPDNKGKRFLIAQQDRFRLRLLDENGSELFEKDYLGASKLVVQYFSFTDAAALIAVTDPDQEFTYLYDLKGNLLQTQPLNSCCSIVLQMVSTGDSLRLVKAYDNAVEQFTLPVINSSK